MTITIQIIQVRFCSIIEGNAVSCSSLKDWFTYSNLSGYFPLSDRVTACSDRPEKKLWISNGSPTPMRQAIAHSAILTLLRSSSRVSQTTLRHRSSIQHLLALAMKLILLPPSLRIHNPWRLRPLVLLVHGPLPATEI